MECCDLYLCTCKILQMIITSSILYTQNNISGCDLSLWLLCYRVYKIPCIRLAWSLGASEQVDAAPLLFILWYYQRFNEGSGIKWARC